MSVRVMKEAVELLRGGYIQAADELLTGAIETIENTYVEVYQREAQRRELPAYMRSVPGVVVMGRSE